MFYFDEFNGKKVLKSDLLKEVTAFFTTREGLPNFGNIPVISPTQTHSSNVEIVDDRVVYENTDGLIITKPDTVIALRFADCTPLIFYDAINKIGAVSHAGWRGTAAKIGVETVKRMQKDFGTNPSDIIALIGPAISVCCYEVSEDVKEKLLSTVNNTADLYEGRNVDLKKINSRQLEEIGVRNIDICPYCTSCNNDLFYSYRKENGTDKRHHAVLRT